MGRLLEWEFAFYKALHVLRDGVPLPVKRHPFLGFSAGELHKTLAALEQMSPAHYWLATKSFAAELGEHVNLARPPSTIDLLWAEEARDEEIHRVRAALIPANLKAEQRRRDVWNQLLKAKSKSDLVTACRSWAQLPDTRANGMERFAAHVSENAQQFLFMKRNKRFPSSNYADDSRLEYLARGMAGLMVGLSPMTAIERLRNMNHTPGGPMWRERWGGHELPATEQHCDCWRCSIDRSTRAENVVETGYDNGLRHFIELAASARVPKQWPTTFRDFRK